MGKSEWACFHRLIGLLEAMRCQQNAILAVRPSIRSRALGTPLSCDIPPVFEKAEKKWIRALLDCRHVGLCDPQVSGGNRTATYQMNVKIIFAKKQLVNDTQL